MKKRRNEARVMKRIMEQFTEGSQRLFRNNVGALQVHPEGPYMSFGVGGKSGSDLIGWTSIEITPAMVGSRIAVFCAVEVKDGDYQATPEQEEFIRKVKGAGGRAGVARSLPEARRILGK